MQTHQIVFEGIDNSGKTTLSRLFEAYMHDNYHFRWHWTKEPDFSTEEADALNFKSMDEVQREIAFLESRVRAQTTYTFSNTIVDRSRWTGVAYAKVFSPSIYKFVEELYVGSSMFKKPTAHVFLDTPVEVCHSREPSVPIESLFSLREAYLETLPLFEKDEKVIILTPSEGETPEELLVRLVEILKTEVPFIFTSR